MSRAARTLLLVTLLATLPAAAAPDEADGDAPTVRVKLDAREYALGRSDAPLTIVEFTDYQCPYCRKFQAQTFPQLKARYIDTGKVRFIVRDLPLDFHSGARPAAEAAHCAAEQGKFWEMHAALLSGDDALSASGIDRRAQAVGLDLPRLHACTQAARYEGAIARNAATADALAIHGTPAFVIGRAQRDGVLEGALVQGAQPWEVFDSGLSGLLAAGG